MSNQSSAWSIVREIVAVLAVAAIVLSLWMLHGETDGIVIESDRVGTTPVTVYRPAASGKAPVRRHRAWLRGFAAAHAILRLAFARNGYVAVTFDFPGHGRNRAPMTRRHRP